MGNELINQRWIVGLKPIKTGGIRRFYSGISTYLLRMVPNSAIQFWCI